MSGELDYPGTDRASFLARVSGALGRGVITPPATPAPAVDGSVCRVTSAGEDLVIVFAERADASGMVVHRTQANRAREQVRATLAAVGARRVAVPDDDRFADLAESLRTDGIETLPCRGGLEPLYAADAGVTDVQAAIAETGSLVCCPGPRRGRGLSLAPPVHIAVVRRSDIVPDLIDYWASTAAQSPQTLPSTITLITGPSKTADIEGVLITGVHGPREVHIVLIEDD